MEWTCWYAWAFSGVDAMAKQSSTQASPVSQVSQAREEDPAAKNKARRRLITIAPDFCIFALERKSVWNGFASPS